MILDEVTLHNFGVYRDRQTITLSPPARDQPVILFGGLNGGGKTTLLDALQLVLYGRQARCSNRNGLAYEDFLRRCINRAVAPSEGAAIELQFRRRSEGKEHVYRVHRSWVENGSGMKERLEVLQDGRFDSVVTDSWGERVQEFLPARLSQLFFFDGDRIEALADLESSSELLASAINSLLGLDYVDRLMRDLLVLERRKRTAAASTAERRDIEELGRSLEEIESRRTGLVEQRAALQNEVDLWGKRSRQLDERFRLEGGELLQRRDQLEVERSAKASQIEKVEQTLRELADGALPLVMVGGLLDVVALQSDVEQRVAVSRELIQLLDERDRSLLDAVLALDPPAHLTDHLTDFLRSDRDRRAQDAAADCYLELSSSARTSIAALRAQLTVDAQIAQERIAAVDRATSDLIGAERLLAGVPDSAALEQLMSERETCRLRLMDANARLGVIDEEIARLNREIEQKRARLAARIETTVGEDFGREDATRIVQYSQRTRGTLARFREAVVERHVSRIQALVFESFSTLLHKRSLVQSLTIDPKTFALTLRDQMGNVVLPERLSAGERQLLAVSLLWGLARASGHALPAIIDTPLGRLDTQHRSHLVERYFPHASHQVVLLSTDEEIDERHYAKLRPWVGRAYRLAHDDASGSTRVETGYFW